MCLLDEGEANPRSHLSLSALRFFHCSATNSGTLTSHTFCSAFVTWRPTPELSSLTTEHALILLKLPRHHVPGCKNGSLVTGNRHRELLGHRGGEHGGGAWRGDAEDTFESAQASRWCSGLHPRIPEALESGNRIRPGSLRQSSWRLACTMQRPAGRAQLKS